MCFHAAMVSNERFIFWRVMFISIKHYLIEYDLFGDTGVGSCGTSVCWYGWFLIKINKE